MFFNVFLGFIKKQLYTKLVSLVNEVTDTDVDALKAKIIKELGLFLGTG